MNDPLHEAEPLHQPLDAKDTTTIILALGFLMGHLFKEGNREGAQSVQETARKFNVTVDLVKKYGPTQS